MASQAFDPQRYKTVQRTAWNNIASGKKKWWDLFEHGAQSVSDHLVALAEVQPGQRILDIATGIGEPALTAARATGPTGLVLATDRSPQMLIVAQERARASGIHTMQFRELDADVLDLPEHNFNAILSRLGLMYLTRLPFALARMRELLLPGGHLAAAVWGPPARVPLISVAMDTIRQHVQAPTPAPGTPGPFTLADAALLEQLLRQSGFVHVRSEYIVMTCEFQSPEEYMHFHQEFTVPIPALLAHQPAEVQAEAWHAVRQAAQSYTTNEGVLRFSNAVLCVVGQRE
jgi:ubiquinone/menaquinone biosynthesis C-methylase UbiE